MKGGDLKNKNRRSSYEDSYPMYKQQFIVIKEKHMVKRIIIFLAIFSLIATFAFAEGQKEEGAETATAGDTVKIGIVSPQSGNYADHGAMERVGMKMAVDDFGGKVLGRTIELIEVDSETNPDIAARRAKRLIQANDVKFLMGGVSSSVAIAVSAVCDEEGALFIASNQNSDTLNGEHAKKTMFRTPPGMAPLVRGSAQWVADNLGKKWYFMTHDYSWGWSGTEWAREMLEPVGATEVGEAKVPLGTRDFSSFLLKISNSDADVVVCTVGGFDMIAMYRQMNDFGIFDKMAVWHTLENYADAISLEPEQRGAYGTYEIYHTINDELKAFSDRMNAEYPGQLCEVVESNAYHGWLSMKALLQGMEEAGNTDVGDVIAAMEGMVIEDNMQPHPTVIRPWDHQMLDSIFFGQDKKVSGTDIVEIFFSEPAEKWARTKEENPIDLTKESY